MLPAFMLPMLIGGGIGAITNKRDPLKGALTGAAMGGIGSMALPAMMGTSVGAATAGIIPGSEQAAMLAAQESGSGLLGNMGWKGATTGLQGAVNNAGGWMGAAEKIGRPVSTAMNAAQMFSPGEQPNYAPPPPSIMPPTASPNLNQIVQGNEANWQNQLAYEQQKRDERRKRIGLLGMG